MSRRGRAPRYALWGELMSTRALKLKATGAVLDGYWRDSAGILDLGFPTFGYGILRAGPGAARQGRRFWRHRSRSAACASGRATFCSAIVTACLVIPREAEAEAIAKALEKVATENKVRQAIEEGMSAEDAFQRFGVM